MCTVCMSVCRDTPWVNSKDSSAPQKSFQQKTPRNTGGWGIFARPPSYSTIHAQEANSSSPVNSLRSIERTDAYSTELSPRSHDHHAGGLREHLARGVHALDGTWCEEKPAFITDLYPVPLLQIVGRRNTRDNQRTKERGENRSAGTSNGRVPFSTTPGTREFHSTQLAMRLQGRSSGVQHRRPGQTPEFSTTGFKKGFEK